MLGKKGALVGAVSCTLLAVFTLSSASAQDWRRGEYEYLDIRDGVDLFTLSAIWHL